MRPVLSAVSQHHSFGKLSIIGKTAELRWVAVRMHHGNRSVGVPQQVAAFGKLLHLVSHALKQGAPCHVAGASHSFNGTSQPLRVHGPAQPFPQEMGREKVLDPQPWNHGLLKTTELTGQERCCLSCRKVTADFQKVEDSASG